jgi:CRP-like cAMP-binding protein
MPDSTTTALRRIMGLRRFPLFASANIDEVATLAENLTENTFPPGAVLAAEGSRPRAVALLLEGRVESVPAGRSWTGPAVLGALEVFAEQSLEVGWMAVTEVRTLQLSASDVGELLEDNVGVMLAVLRELGHRLLAQGAPSSPARLPAAQQFGLVERLLTLRQQLPFRNAQLAALTALAKSSHEVHWPAGAEVMGEQDPEPFGLIVLDGELRLQQGDTRGPGSSLGLVEAIAGVRPRPVHAATPVRALRTNASAIFDVIEDHTDVGLAMIAAFASALLQTGGAHASIA